MSARRVPHDSILMQEYVENGLSSGDISEKYKCARGSVCKHLRRLGITRPESGQLSRNRKRNGEVVKSGYPVTHLPDHPRSSSIGIRAKLRTDSSNPYVGILKNKRAGGYDARVGYEGQTIYLGRYDDPAEAAYVYDQAAYQLYGDRARLNFL